MKKTLLSILAGLMLGCSEKRELPFEYKSDFRTPKGIFVDAPSWIDPRDHKELGDVIDSYYDGFHQEAGRDLLVNYLLIKIPEQPGECELNSEYFSLIGGLYDSETDFIFVTWAGSMDNPDILPQLPHELGHRFIYLTTGNVYPNHQFPENITQAVQKTKQHQLFFNGDTSRAPGIRWGKCE